MRWILLRCLILAVAAAGCATAPAPGGGQGAVDAATEAAPPPGAEREVRFEFEDDDILPGTVELTAQVVNDGPAEVVYGPRARLWTWDGQDWNPIFALVTGVAIFTPHLSKQPEPLTMPLPDLGIGAPAGGMGTQERVPVPYDLEPGHYRITRVVQAVGDPGQDDEVTIEGRFMVEQPPPADGSEGAGAAVAGRR